MKRLTILYLLIGLASPATACVSVAHTPKTRVAKQDCARQDAEAKEDEDKDKDDEAKDDDDKDSGESEAENEGENEAEAVEAPDADGEDQAEPAEADDNDNDSDNDDGSDSDEAPQSMVRGHMGDVDSRPVMVSSPALEALRTAGDAVPLLLASARNEAVQDGMTKIVAAVKLCVSELGVPSSVTVMRSTGYSDADEVLAGHMRKWRFRPYTQDGKATAACAAMVFQYKLDQHGVGAPHVQPPPAPEPPPAMEEPKDDDEEQADPDEDSSENVAPTPPTLPAPPAPPAHGRVRTPPAPPAAPTPPTPPTHGRNGTATLRVTGPVSFHIETAQGGVQISTGAAAQVTVNASACTSSDVRLEQTGNDVYAQLDDLSGCRGPVKIAVPAGSDVEVHTSGGEIGLSGTYGNVEAHAVSGGVSVDHAVNVQVEAVSGKVSIQSSTGKVKVETVSGNAEISQASQAPKLRYQTTKGGLMWHGTCGRGCRLEVDSFSGGVDLALDPSSSFTLKYASRKGELHDELGLASGKDRPNAYGAGEGSIKVASFQGSLHLH